LPLTFLSHQAPVLPLKIAAPQWFDGTALVVGSMVPDLVFLTHGTDWYVDAHAVVPQLWLCLPLTIVLTWISKRVVAGPLAAHMPDAGTLHVHDYGRLDAWRLPTRPLGWLVLAGSALVGSFSHLLFDSFTHGFGWFVQNFDPLQAQAFELPTALTGRPVYVHDLLQLAGTVVGAFITLWCLFVIGRRRLLIDWYPVPDTLEPTTASRRHLVFGVSAGFASGLGTALVTRHVGGAQDLINRIADLTFVGVVLGSVSARSSMILRREAAA
jgi:hypothetical protein